MGKFSLRTADNVTRGNSYRTHPSNIIVDEKSNPRTLLDEDSYGTPEEWEEWLKDIAKGVKDSVRVTIRDGKFHLTHGFRRMRAVNQLIAQGHDIPSVPILVVEDNTETILLEHLSLNSGKPFTVIETASILSQLLKLAGNRNYTTLAQRVGMDAQKVRNYVLFIERASEKTKARVNSKQMSFATAQKTVASYGNIEEQNAVIDEAEKTANGGKITVKHIGGKVNATALLHNPYERSINVLRDVITHQDADDAFLRDHAKLCLDLLLNAKNTKISKEELIELFRNKIEENVK